MVTRGTVPLTNDLDVWLGVCEPCNPVYEFVYPWYVFICAGRYILPSVTFNTVIYNREANAPDPVMITAL